mmetsp:Transcript_2315/g.3631  ORF Transcript_2315/g.3631 Transcript_2315/m.3631 type:complete len:85 (+) Transcript_2315:3-257(+)
MKKLLRKALHAQAGAEDHKFAGSQTARRHIVGAPNAAFRTQLKIKSEKKRVVSANQSGSKKRRKLYESCLIHQDVHIFLNDSTT